MVEALWGSTYINKTGFAVLIPLVKKLGTIFRARFFSGADYGDRTRHLDLGKVALYQMS